MSALEHPRGINVLITGTPGTGKSSMAAVLAQELGEDFSVVEIGKVVREQRFYSAYDEELDTHTIEEDDEDRLLDYLEPIMVHGGNHIVDYHSCELFPERWFHLVVVLRASTETLFERLKARGYSEKKREENIDAEIFGVCEEETRNSYADSIIIVRDNNTLEEMTATVELIVARVAELREAAGSSPSSAR